MAKCRICKLEVLDETEVCPLCRSILDPTDAVENMYPNVRRKIRRLKLISNIYLFLAVCLEAALICINIVTTSQIWWSVITGLALFYFHLVLRYAILGKSGYRSKIFVLTLIAVLSAVAVDMVVGYRGWSVDYVLPAGIVLVDVVILGCMFFNRRNWQSYMMWQLLMILCSLVPALLFWMGMEHNGYLAVSPFAISCAMVLGTLIIGDRRARMELLRRFHV